MEAIRHTVLPRRLTQMYADTKKSYEHIVQTSYGNPHVSSVLLKLRIQKDRLIAWGLQWNDSTTTQSGDIDSSLGRAGLGDLVASIMSSIRELLDEADRIHPSQAHEMPGAFPNTKSGHGFSTDALWDTKHSMRLNDIVKDITASIDTLCDLSRSQQMHRGVPSTQNNSQLAWKATPIKDTSERRLSHSKSLALASALIRAASTGLVASTRIDPSRIRVPESNAVPGPSPPSYESVAAGSDDRMLAYLMASSDMKNTDDQLQSSESDVPVLLDYGCVHDTNPIDGHLPSIRRYEDLCSALDLSLQSSVGNVYSGTLKLLGWFDDPRRSRYAFVYEVPRTRLSTPISSGLNRVPHSLLSFLQHGADTDSTNMPSLEDRFRLAFNLASSVLHLHAKGLCHRNMNSTNVLFFVDEVSRKSTDMKLWKTGAIRQPYMSSFDQWAEDAPTQHPEPLMTSIYRHPAIERGQRAAYKPIHDVYSLGLILLEIGLWMPLSRLWKPKYVRWSFKSRLHDIYVKKLAAKCGSSYMNLVDYCLGIADGPSVASEPEQYQSNKKTQIPKFQTQFYWKVVKELERCCMIDHGDDEMAVSDAADVVSVTDVKEMGAHELKIPRPENHTAVSADLQNIQKFESFSAGPINSEKSKQPAKPQCRYKVWSHELPTTCTAYWNSTMLPHLNRILTKVTDRWESVEIELAMVGETAEMARPTIYMVCASTDKARKALQYLNRDKRLFDIKVSKGQMTRSKAGKKRKGKPHRKIQLPASTDGAPPIVKDLETQKQHYQQRPACGASIGAYLDNQHLPPVSFGGTILVNGEPYGMSVHHMLENDELDHGLNDEFDFQRSMAPRDKETSSSWNPPALPWGPGNLSEVLYPFEISEDEDEGYLSSAADDDAWLYDSSALDYDDDNEQKSEGEDMEMGDTLGIIPGQGGDLFITQPAIDDVDSSFFPSEEDMDDDHLSSHTFGHIHASSGIKRSNRGAISHEVDWALIKVKETRSSTKNFVAGGGRHCKSTAPAGWECSDSNAEKCSASADIHSYPSQVVKAEDLGGLRVHALGRTSGLQTGIIMPAMTMVKMPGRVSFSHSWRVRGGFGDRNITFMSITDVSTYLVGGDSGAWVIDNASGGVCAHVLAWSSVNGTAYISPMEVLMDDMAERLGVDVKLPKQSADEASSLREELRDNSEEQHPIVTGEQNDEIDASQVWPGPEAGSSSMDLRKNFDVETGGNAEEEPCTYRQCTASSSIACSPPLSTSPPYDFRSLNLIDDMAEQCFPDTEALRHVTTHYQPRSRRDMLDGGRGMQVERERGGGLQAR